MAGSTTAEPLRRYVRTGRCVRQWGEILAICGPEVVALPLV